jgi:hypothetical protein
VKTYFIRTAQNSRAVLEALKRAVIEHENVLEYDKVFSLSYDREDQFFLKTGETIFWGRIYASTASHKDVADLAREIQKVAGTFNLPLKPYIFFQELRSGQGLLKALPEHPRCYEFSFLRSGDGSALGLKDLNQAPPKVLPPLPDDLQSILPPDLCKTVSSFRLSRSEISELIEISLELKHPKG